MKSREISWFRRLLWTDRRSGMRHKAPHLVVYYSEGGKSEPHALRDVSASGLFMLTEHRWYPGTIIRMTLQNTRLSEKNVQQAITLQARVVRAETDGVGFAFEQPPRKSAGLSRDAALEVDMNTIESFLRRAECEVAQALIEYLLLLPIVLLLVVNIVNMGGFFFAWITVANTSRAAANYAAMAGASAGGVQAASVSKILAMVTTEVSSLPNNPSVAVDICRNFKGTITLSGTCNSIQADPEPTSYVLTSIDIYYTYQPFVPAGFHFSNLNVYVTIPPTTIHRRTVMRTLQ